MAHLKSFFDTEIPVHVPKLSAEIKKKKRWKKYQLFNQIFEAIGSSRLFILCTKQPFYIWLRVHSHEAKWTSNRHENKFCSHDVSFPLHFKTIFWRACVGISLQVVSTLYFITWNEISFLTKWLQWNNTGNKFH